MVVIWKYLTSNFKKYDKPKNILLLHTFSQQWCMIFWNIRRKLFFEGLLFSYHDKLILAGNSFVRFNIFNSKFCTKLLYFWHSRHESVCLQTVWRLAQRLLLVHRHLHLDYRGINLQVLLPIFRKQRLWVMSK